MFQQGKVTNLYLTNMFNRMLVLTLVWLSSPNNLCGQELELKARSLAKAELPLGFPMEVLDAGFAVIEITLKNNRDSAVELRPDRILIRSANKKKLSRVSPEKILAKLKKFFRGQYGMERDVYTGSSLPPPGGKNDLGGAGILGPVLNQILVILKGYQLKGGSLEKGELIQGYIYVKSKKWGPSLSGGRAQLDDSTTLLE